MILHSGGDVLATYLWTTGVVTQPSLNQPWPMSFGSMPATGAPDNYSTCYDTTGLVDGRYMKTGKTIDHPGILLRFRGRNSREITKKMMALLAELDEIKRNVITVEGKSYTIQSFKRTTSIITLGPEEGTGRLLYTVNGVMTYFETPP